MFVLEQYCFYVWTTKNPKVFSCSVFCQCMSSTISKKLNTDTFPITYNELLLATMAIPTAFEHLFLIFSGYQWITNTSDKKIPCLLSLQD
ncbi:hypothetical protein AXF35_04670 [Legionella pneumophila subsp. pascullei]|uniref:Uncharacterized protein n=2 Tax=Legionella pneumophila TaxID=446 RepID=A0AAX2IZI3_LEGPN|nr:hypothetical protein AXF35_04670 [Legionella pneumophila subsp. pascullei]AMP93315.1 hypothetical protein AXF36_12120 [Legionella pneumophila subsp. pascullei]AMP96281.1 hypothetical protein AXF37_12010 [Legionella pneumophila subsp. pascullei]SQG91245.1 Uncharacterised protein [Legionella pneumophila subsp. pascullei]VEH07791.1 Uncharacterised protein [Legionella pneumophila subsp. pascullei]